MVRVASVRDYLGPQVNHEIPTSPPARELSVVVCTRNPRPALLAETLGCLANQSIAPVRWELVVVDNGSAPPVRGVIDDFPAAWRLVVEPEPGLTRARLRGIREARGGLIVFVDDDNLLDTDYLQTAADIAARHPKLGAFGGRISPRFEVPPPEWLEPFRSHLALVDFQRDDMWGSEGPPIVPCGAGLCVRREAALAYAEMVAADPRRLGLGRTASSTISCDDTDLVFTCLDQGWTSGRFVALHLTHVIPAERLTLEYQVRLAAGIGYSYGRLEAIRGRASKIRIARAALRSLRAWLGILHRGPVREIELAFHYGVYRGILLG